MPVFRCATANTPTVRKTTIKELVFEQSKSKYSRRILVAAAWPYANGPRHLGHVAGFAVPADVYARYHRLRGNNVLFVSGTDEHGTPIAVAAEAEGVAPADLASRYNAVIRKDLADLGISYDLFTRTTTVNHAEVVSKIFEALWDGGYISEHESLGAFAGARALPDRYIEGTCPHCGDGCARGDQCDACCAQLDPTDLIDPRSRVDGATPEFRLSKHLFLNLPALAPALQEFVSARRRQWRPNVVALTEALLAEPRERAITRDLDWGVPIPVSGYEHKRFYVWFDAVIGYLSASIEWAGRQGNPEAWRQWWEDEHAYHSYFLGKDNIAFHTIIWPAILAGAGAGAYGPLHFPDQVAASEFLTVGGAKFASSRGRVIYVRDVLRDYQADALRYYLIAAGPETSDTEFTWEEFVRRTNNELVANYGNLCQRVLALAHRACGVIPEPGILAETDRRLLDDVAVAFTTVGTFVERCQFKAALSECLRVSTLTNKYFSECEPWSAQCERVDTVLWVCLQAISDLRILFAPFLPLSSQQLHEVLGYNGRLQAQPLNLEEEERLVLDGETKPQWCSQPLPSGHVIEHPQPLFTKLSALTAEEENARSRQ